MTTQTETLRKFEPAQSHGVAYRLIAGLLSSERARDVGMACARRADPLLKALIGSPLGPHLPMPLGIVTNTGAKSGIKRETALLFFTEGEDVILIGSNFGGAKNPSWYYNLRVNPDAIVRCGRVRKAFVASEVTDPEEHERLYQMAEKIYAGYPAYRVKTAAVGRRIPIMRLRPAD